MPGTNAVETGINDPLLYRAPLPYRGRYYPYGFPVDIASDMREVLDAAHESFGAYAPRFDRPPLRVHVLTSQGSGVRPPAPVLRGQRHLLMWVADQENFAAIDRRQRFGDSCVTRATVVLGVSGGIAAYKAVELCRRLVDAGCHVVPVLTANATRFVGQATFSALASEPARLDMFADDVPIPHTELGRRADLVLVAPATARVIGAYAAGISSDLLVATLLATRAPVLVCPAMHTEMWEHAAVQENLATLRRRGVCVLEPETGRLAGGRSEEHTS